ncbi:MAG TPA: hypothetical protein VL625_11150 [Patescibacteria group bacterium]|nr:hypothetical protein [Patescibacteria group bacterium]
MAAGGKTPEIFKDAGGWNTPSGIMALTETYLSGVNGSIPVSTAEATMRKMMPKGLHGGLEAFTKDGQIDRAGLVNYMAAMGNTVDGGQPSDKLVRQARDMLFQLGIQDDGTNSVGLARMSMMGSTPTPAPVIASTANNNTAFRPA